MQVTTATKQHLSSARHLTLPRRTCKRNNCSTERSCTKAWPGCATAGTLPGQSSVSAPLSSSILFPSILFYSILFYSILFYPLLFCPLLFSSILVYPLLSSLLSDHLLSSSILSSSILFYPLLLYSLLLSTPLSYPLLFSSILFSILFDHLLLYPILFCPLLSSPLLSSSLLFSSLCMEQEELFPNFISMRSSFNHIRSSDKIQHQIMLNSPLLLYCTPLILSLLLFKSNQVTTCAFLFSFTSLGINSTQLKEQLHVWDWWQEPLTSLPSQQ